MATAAILDFGCIAISRPAIIRFWPNLVCRHKFWLRPRKFIQNLNFSKFNMADGGHLENIRNVITSQNIDQFARNLVRGVADTFCLPNLERLSWELGMECVCTCNSGLLLSSVFTVMAVTCQWGLGLSTPCSTHHIIFHGIYWLCMYTAFVAACAAYNCQNLSFLHYNTFLHQTAKTRQTAETDVNTNVHSSFLCSKLFT